MTWWDYVRRSTAGEEKWKQTKWPSPRLLVLIILMWRVRDGDAAPGSEIRRKGMSVAQDRDPCYSDDGLACLDTAPTRFRGIRQCEEGDHQSWWVLHGTVQVVLRCILKSSVLYARTVGPTSTLLAHAMPLACISSVFRPAQWRSGREVPFFV